MTSLKHVYVLLMKKHYFASQTSTFILTYTHPSCAGLLDRMTATEESVTEHGATVRLHGFGLVKQEAFATNVLGEVLGKVGVCLKKSELMNRVGSGLLRLLAL